MKTDTILTTHPQNTFQPVSQSERIEVIDALRGFALLGILLVNIWSFSRYEWLSEAQTGVLPTHLADAYVKNVLEILIDTKFITIFSVLFGVGFSVQIDRATTKGVSFRRYYIRRMLLLFLIACLHAYLLWFGDIIRYYAVIGLLLLLVCSWPTGRILRTGIIFSVLVTPIVFILNGILPIHTAPSHVNGVPLGQYIYSAFTQYSYGEMIRANWLIDPLNNLVQDVPIVLVSMIGKILIGFWLGRIGLFAHPERYQRMLRLWLWGGLPLGMVASVTFWALKRGLFDLESPWLLWVPFAGTGGLIMHSCFYMSLFLKLYHQRRWHDYLRRFAPVGRMALSNYIGQTMLGFGFCYGLGLVGKIGPSLLLPLSLVIFGIQVAWSQWWLKSYEYGPVEWIWRRLSYRNFP